MSYKNYNIKISEEEEQTIKILRDKYCINISQYIRKCLTEKYKELENGRENRKANKNL
jgi:hypothetical protein